MLNYKQSIMARTLLDWSKTKLSEESRIPYPTITKFEQGKVSPSIDTVKAIYEAFSAHGIIFKGEYSVDKKANRVFTLQGEDAIYKLWDIVIESFKASNGGDYLISCADERRAIRKHGDRFWDYLDQLEELGVKQHLIVEEGNMLFPAKAAHYRWMDKSEYKVDRPCYIFNDYVALVIWHSNTILVLQDEKAAQEERDHFLNIWKGLKTPIQENDNDLVRKITESDKKSNK